MLCVRVQPSACADVLEANDIAATNGLRVREFRVSERGEDLPQRVTIAECGVRRHRLLLRAGTPTDRVRMEEVTTVLMLELHQRAESDGLEPAVIVSVDVVIVIFLAGA